MALLVGVATAAARLGQNPWRSTSLDANTGATGGAARSTSTSSGSRAALVPVVAPAVTFAGQPAAGSNLWEKLIVVPGSKKLGMVASTQSYNVEIWNTSRSVGYSLDAITISGDGGLQLVGAVPGKLFPACSQIYAATIPGDGSATISNVATWTVDTLLGTGLVPAPSVSHLVTGMRIVAFPYLPNWSGKIRETSEYLTTVFPSRNGTEQRTGRRLFPRRGLEFDVAAISAQEAQALDMLLTVSQGRPFAAPWWQDNVRFRGTLAAGATQIAVSTANSLFPLAPLVMVWSSPTQCEIQTVQSVSAGLVVCGALSQAYTNPLVMPAFPAHLPDQIELGRPVTGYAKGVIRFVCDVGSNDVRPSPESMTQAYGFDVLEARPNWKDPKQHVGRLLQTLDDGAGSLEVSDLAGLSFQGRDFLWTAGSRAEIQSLRDFLDRRSGRRIPFWVPTWREDLTLSAAAVGSSQGIVVNACGYTASAFPYAFRKYLAIRTPAGAWIYRKATSSSASANTETIGLDATLGQALPAGTKVSFLTLCRLADDEAKIEWFTQSAAACALEFVELPREVPA